MAQNVYNDALLALKIDGEFAMLPTSAITNADDGTTWVDISADTTQVSVNTNVTPIETFTFGREFSNVSAGKKSGDVSFQALLDYGGDDGDVRTQLDVIDERPGKDCAVLFMPEAPSDSKTIPAPSVSNPQYIFNAKLLNDTPITASAQDQASLIDVTMRVDGSITKLTS